MCVSMADIIIASNSNDIPLNLALLHLLISVQLSLRRYSFYVLLTSFASLHCAGQNLVDAMECGN